MRNLLLLLAVILAPKIAVAQLFVSPDGATDSYIYVKDQVLYVEDNIRINPNNVGSTYASIYLRDGAQLIQGAGTTPNSGTGLISIYQTVDETSNYHYNFWHSPVGFPNGSGNQNSGLSRIYDIVDLTDSDAVSSTGGHNGDATTTPMTISRRWIYKRLSSPDNEQEANYIYVGHNNNIEPGYGFTMKGVSNGAVTQSVTYDFRGRANNGTITVPVNAGTQWTLSGNPYPSAIDLKLFYADNIANGVTEVLFWDEPKNSEYSHQYADKSGGYGTWIPGPGVGDVDPGLYTAPTFANYDASGLGSNAGTGTGPVVDRRYSPVGQGFVVETTNASSTTFTLKNDYRIWKKIGEVSEFRNPTGGTYSDYNGNTGTPTNPNAGIVPQIRINVGMDEAYARQLLIAFSPNSTNGYDIGLDAHHPMDAAGSEAYFPISVGQDSNIEPFVIQTVPFEVDKNIPLTIVSQGETKVSVTGIDLVNLPPNQTVFVYDNSNNSYQAIDDGRSASYLLPEGEYKNRFYIVFKDGNKAPTEPIIAKTNTKKANASVTFFQNNPLKVLEISNPDGYTIDAAYMYDVTGKLVYSANDLGKEASYKLPTHNLSDGIYLVKLITDTNIGIDYKMSVYNK